MYFNLNDVLFGEDWKVSVCVCESRILFRLSTKHINNMEQYGIFHWHYVPNSLFL